MPSPVGHALGGVIAGLLVLPRPGCDVEARATSGSSLPRGSSRARAPAGAMSLVVLAALLPDADLLWASHNMETHSLGAAALAGLAVLAAARGRAPRLALACALAWTSHVLFDWLGSDDSPPFGVMALWPLSTDYSFAHAYVFDAIVRRYRQPGFVARNLWAVAKEVVLLAPPVAALCWRRRTARGGTVEPSAHSAKR